MEPAVSLPVYITLVFVFIPSYVNPVHTILSYFLKIIVLESSLLHLGLLIGLFSLSPIQNPVAVSLLPHTCHLPCPFFRHIVRKKK